VTDYDHTSIDELLQSRARLAIVAFLAGADEADFSAVRDAASVHLRKLEDAGYVAMRKHFVGRKPQTLYVLTQTGRQALLDYVAHLESLIQPAQVAGNKGERI
jgi:DNA-binding transcriptional ArsR family regulator